MAKIEVVDGRVVTIDTDGKVINDFGEMKVRTTKKDPLERRKRWKKGSWLTEEQTIDESYQEKTKLA